MHYLVTALYDYPLLAGGEEQSTSIGRARSLA